ncbi:DUF3597 domain-containing protein [Qipengyuania sp.]|uniref:DUF3597 domain-containing protein n=1 Tax=Qipengyuania sp. TaxID=2004515 RepID=UPI00373522C7
MACRLIADPAANFIEAAEKEDPMNLFGKLKDAIFGKKAHAQTAPQATPSATPAAPGNAWAAAPVVEQKAVDVVDVEQSLDAMPGADNLNWRTSIVDLMKLVGIDSDFASRKELAQELGRSDYGGSAEDNIWLHKRVMKELAANGGKVPADLRD